MGMVWGDCHPYCNQVLEEAMSDGAGTFKSPRFILAALVFVGLMVGVYMDVVDTATLTTLGAIALGGYFANNAVKGILVKK